ncbi:AI-2E family transporter [Chondrinema litorale]|uniref:AI-2E family transporter n=1 Tax=Chondrinema litorale TaxID=2994555 RepID=UPI002543131A|nr:AI-2E family transporter [Chondrinema litorale]UZR98642.1 AI-2E family transporter [Chondrinema litorale]
MKTFKRIDYSSKILFIVVVVILALFFLKALLAPIFFSAFIAVLLLPICDKLESWKVSRVLSIVLVLVTITLTILLLFYLFSAQINSFLNDFPNIESKIQEDFNHLLDTVSNWFGISQSEQENYLKKISSNFMSSGGRYATRALGVTSDVISFLGMVPIYCFLILLYRDKFIKGFLQFFSKEKHKEIDNMLVQMKDTIQSYFFGLMKVVGIIAVLNTVGLLLLGIKYAVFLALFSALLTVLPYVGVVVGGLLPVMVALVTKDSIWYAAGVVGIYWLVQFLEGNYITPKVVGSEVKLNAMAVIFGLLAFGQLWGLIGLILAVPSMAVIKLVCSHFDSLQGVATILGKD